MTDVPDVQTITAADVAAVPVGPKQWPEGYDPPPDGWEWKLVDIACDHCGATNQIHEQPPQWLDVRHPVGGHRVGIVWACNACGAKNNLGGEAPRVPDTSVLECANCHSTFAPSQTEIAADGTWKCRVCDTENRALVALDSGDGADQHAATDAGSGSA